MNLLFLDITQVSKSVVFLADGLLTYTLFAYYLIIWLRRKFFRGRSDQVRADSARFYSAGSPPK